MEKYVIIAILVLFAVVFIISICQKRMEMFLNFVLRFLAGAVGIYLLNSILAVFQIGTMVGFNSLNVFIIGLLGLPGFVMLYGLGFYLTL